MQRVHRTRAVSILTFAFMVLVAGIRLAPAQEYQQKYDKLKSDWAKAYAENKAPFDKTLEAADAAYRAISVANAKIALADKPDEKKKAQAEHAAASKTAYTQFKLAFSKLPDETDENREQLNEVRYRTAFLSYENKKYADAAIIAEFICRKHPKNKFALHSTKIAIASHRLRYNEAKEEKAKEEVLQDLMEICAYTSKQFSETAEGAEARRVLAELALYAKNVKQAEKILEMFEKGSAEHSQLLLKIAQVKWFNFFAEANKPKAERAAPEELAAMKKEAKAAFKNATEELRKKEKDKPSPDLLKGELSLIQIYNMEGQFAEAKKLLELPKTGLKEHARLNLKAIQGEKDMRQMIYTSALKTYLGLKQFNDAQEMAESLAIVGGGKADPAAMTGLFGSLAKQLYDDFQAMLVAKAAREELIAAADSLAGLLNKLASQKEGHTYQSLVWPAEKLYDLGLSMNNAGVPEKHKEFLDQAVKIYNLILTKGQEDSEFVTKDNANAIRFKLAEIQRQLGNTADALKELVSILKQFPNRLPVQLEAAYAYQDLAEELNKADMYDLAINGGEPVSPPPGEKGPDTNVIWGWNKLALMTRTSTKPDHKKMYFSARYNLAFCRMRKAMLSEGADRTKGLIDSLNDVRVTYSFNPKLGSNLDYGPNELVPNYEALTLKLQEMLELEKSGLEGLKAGAGGSVASAKKELAASKPPEPEPASPTNFIAIALVMLMGGGAVIGIIYFAYLKPKRPSMAARRR